MAARIASKSRSKISTPDLSRSLQRGISVASRNWAHQASVRRPKQRSVACRPPHYSPARSPVSASASSTSAAAAFASSTPPATATAASTSTAATEAPTSATTPTPTPSSASTATTAAPTTPSSSLAPLAFADAAPLTRRRRSAD
ncbi:unnamed protein product [Closterium sp. NIES-54]